MPSISGARDVLQQVGLAATATAASVEHPLSVSGPADAVVDHSGVDRLRWTTGVGYLESMLQADAMHRLCGCTT